MARRADVLLASVLGVAVTLTLASLVVDATDARAREPRDPAEKPGASPCWARSPTNASRLVPKEGGCDGFDADEVGGVDRARKLDECACVYAQAVCDVQPGLVCSVPDGRYVCRDEATGAVGGTAGQELRVPCLQSLCTSVTCPLDPRTLPLGDDGESAAKVCDVCEMYGYTAGTGELRAQEGSRCGGEVRAQGLRFGPKAALLAYSAFMFVDFTMAAAAAGKPLPQDLPTTPQYPEYHHGQPSAPVLLPEILEQDTGGDWQTHEYSPTTTTYEYPPTTTTYEYPPTPPTPPSPSQPPSQPPPSLCDVDDLMDVLPSALPSLVPCLSGSTSTCCQNVANIVGESTDADMTDCLCNRDAFDALAGLLMDNVGLDLGSRLGECVAKGYRINFPADEGGGGGCDRYDEREERSAFVRPRTERKGVEESGDPDAVARDRPRASVTAQGRARNAAGPRAGSDEAPARGDLYR